MNVLNPSQGSHSEDGDSDLEFRSKAKVWTMYLEEAERQDIELRRRSQAGIKGASQSGTPRATTNEQKSATPPVSQTAWYSRAASKPTWATELWKKAAPDAVARLRYLADGKPVRSKELGKGDVEAQHTVGDVLFSGFADELTDENLPLSSCCFSGGLVFAGIPEVSTS